jgi:SAM-dependent methyltransferase
MRKLRWPAPERNKAPLLEVLERVLPERGTVLEIASGSGQHIAYFAEHMPHLRFVPSDVEPEHIESIRAYQMDAGENFLPPRLIDVRADEWQVGPVDAIFNANMIHIAPWSACVGLIDGVRRNLAPGGVFVLYGPFRFEERHTAPSNAQFDESLRAQNVEWGVRDAEDVIQLARIAGLVFRERIAMPANNYCLVFDKPRSGA